MTALKCDVCGAYYDRPKCDPLVWIVVDHGRFGEETLDLCGECEKKLKDFIHYDEVIKHERTNKK